MDTINSFSFLIDFFFHNFDGICQSTLRGAQDVIELNKMKLRYLIKDWYFCYQIKLNISQLNTFWISKSN